MSKNYKNLIGWGLLVAFLCSREFAVTVSVPQMWIFIFLTSLTGSPSPPFAHGLWRSVWSPSWPLSDLQCRFKQSCLCLLDGHCLLDEPVTPKLQPFLSSAFGPSLLSGELLHGPVAGILSLPFWHLQETLQNPALLLRCAWAGESPAWAVVTLHLSCLTSLLVLCLTQMTLFEWMDCSRSSSFKPIGSQEWRKGLFYSLHPAIIAELLRPQYI